ncbi:MAG: hypothetical protein GY913_08265 [Proteobacteria bacterium]|nr:hypothetical protein [Pseudomonadota bacterium]MCP4916904.1 hypothetical protein [Pseudomonadota bacterium]
MWFLLLACAKDPVIDSGIETCGDLPEPEIGACDGLPVVTWQGFGHGFLLTQCQGCHASTAPERYGAPEGVVFDTVEDACGQADRIRARVLDDDSMPPAGGLTEDERVLLSTWLDCFLPYEGL